MLGIIIMAKKKPRISSFDVARRAGLSRTTVSYVLNRRSDVSIPQATRDKVLQAARELGYRPNGIARSLVSGRTYTIGVIVPVLESSFTSDVVNGVEAVCSERQYRLLLAYSHNDPQRERKQAQLLLEHRVDGLIFIPGYRTLPAAYRWLREALAENVPCAIVDDSSSGLPVDYVVSDDRNGATTAVGHLIRLGHRRIGHLCAGDVGSPARERRAGYCAALKAGGLEPAPNLIVGSSFDPASAAASMLQLLDQPEPPTAVFAANDLMAITAIEKVKERGLRVPQDVAFIGFSDFALSQYLNLTTVHRGPAEMGKRAAERLFERIENPHLKPEGRVVPTHLIVRESCGARLAPRSELDEEAPVYAVGREPHDSGSGED